MSHLEVKISVRFVKENGLKRGVLTVELPLSEGELANDFIQPDVHLLGESLTPDWGYNEDGCRYRTEYYELPPKAEISPEDFMRLKERGVLAILKGVAEENRLPEGWENTYTI